MTISDLQTEARRIWPDKMGLMRIAVAMGVVHGDICREVRDDGRMTEMARELGNMIFSSIRWCGDLGLDPEECIRQAITCQEEFVKGSARGE